MTRFPNKGCWDKLILVLLVALSGLVNGQNLIADSTYIEYRPVLCDVEIDSARSWLMESIKKGDVNTYFEFGQRIDSLLLTLDLDSSHRWQQPELEAVQNLYVYQGAYLNNADRYIETVEAYEEGAHWAEKHGLESEFIAHFIYGDPGNVFNRWGELDQAELFLEKSLSSLIDFESWERAVKRMRDLGILYQSKGQLHRSMDIVAEAFALPAAKGGLRGELHEVTVGFLLDTFELSHDTLFLDLAKVHADSALWHYNQLGISNQERFDSLASTIHWLLGKYHSLGGDFAKAEPYLLKSIAARKPEDKAHNRGLAKVLVQYGDALMRAGKYQRAADQYQGMVGAILPGFDPTNFTELPDTHAFYPEHALIEGFQGKATALLALYRETQDISLLSHAWKSCQAAFQAEDVLREKYIYNDSKLSLASEDHQRMELSLEILYELWQIDPKDQVFEWVYQIFERNQSQLLAESFKEMKGAGLLPEDMLARERRLRFEILYLRKKLDKLEHKVAIEEIDSRKSDGRKSDENSGNSHASDDQAIDQPAREKEEILEIMESIRIRGVRLKGLRDSIRILNSGYYAFRYSPQIVPLDRIEKYLLNDDTGLIEYFRGERAIYRLTVQPGRRTFSKITNIREVSENLQALIRRIDEQASAVAVSFTTEDKEQFAHNLHALYRTLWPADAGTLPLRLLVIPDDTLWQIPFEGLLTQPFDGLGADAPYLIRDHSIFYSFSASSQFWLEEIRYRPPIALSYQGFRPTFTGVDSLKLNLSERDLLEKFVRKVGGELWKGKEAFKGRIYQQREFTGVLHIISHAVWDEIQSINSYIAFEGEETKLLDSLTLGEVLVMAPQASLVILEACESGTGQVRNGEGMESLARGFFLSGSHSVIGTGWKSDKVGGEMIIDAFLAKLRPKGKLDLALRDAKLDLLKGESGKTVLDPRVWGAYKLFGSTRPPQIAQNNNNGLLWGGLILLLVLILVWRRKRDE